MKNLERVVLVVVCAGACFATGCDPAEDVDASSQLADPAPAPGGELGELDVMVWPPADASDEPISTAPLAFVSPMTDQQAQSLGSVTATEDLMFGWIQWAMGQPWFDGPVMDTDGDDCGKGQEGPIWYLAGTTGGPVVRHCDVPAGKQLVFPLVNTWCVFPPEFYPTRASIDAESPGIAAWYDGLEENTCALTLRVDGQDVFADLETSKEALFLSVLETRDIEVDEENLWTEYGYDFSGPNPTSGAGYYARLHPLTPGDHVVELGGTLCGDSPFSTAATYYLHVGG